MTALANVAIPSLVGHIIMMFILLIPIALIEACIIWKLLKTEFIKSFGLSLGANTRSTLVGLPLGYLFAVIGLIPAGLFSLLLPIHIARPISSIIGSAIVTGGTIPNRYDSFGFAAGLLVVMVPYFLVTLRVERKYICKETGRNSPEIKKTVLIMNLVTYLILAAPVTFGVVREAKKVVKQNKAISWVLKGNYKKILKFTDMPLEIQNEVLSRSYGRIAEPNELFGSTEDDNLPTNRFVMGGVSDKYAFALYEDSGFNDIEGRLVILSLNESPNMIIIGFFPEPVLAIDDLKRKMQSDKSRIFASK